MLTRSPRSEKRPGRPADTETLDEAEWLLDAGESPWQIAKQLNRSLGSLERLAYRQGRLKMARLFARFNKEMGSGVAA